jgi:2-dehydro-3-deoxyphosphogluconate aldolase / (4S)-4-hydroxy-2-oxoglutarate aldolase
VNRIGEILGMGPVIPVIVIDRLAHAVPLARALVAGGVRVLEVTLRTPAALQAMRAIADEVDGAIVGAGTITRPADFEACRKAGAVFGVSPGLTAELVAGANASGLPLLPGVMTPSEVIAARAAGFRQLKLFPAQQAGGTGMLRALAGPFPDTTFCQRGQCRRVPRIAECRLRRRIVAGAGRRTVQRRLGTHHDAGARNAGAAARRGFLISAAPAASGVTRRVRLIGWPCALPLGNDDGRACDQMRFCGVVPGKAFDRDHDQNRRQHGGNSEARADPLRTGLECAAHVGLLGVAA